MEKIGENQDIFDEGGKIIEWKKIIEKKGAEEQRVRKMAREEDDKGMNEKIDLEDCVNEIDMNTDISYYLLIFD